MLIAVRHARTDFNEDGKERLRAWLPIPISAEGVDDAYQCATFLKTLNLPVSVILSSPMKRSVQTARIIARQLRIQVSVQQALADWNVGKLAGKDAMDTLPLIHRMLDDPSMVPPGGESYAAFRARLDPFMRTLIQSPQPHLCVTHNRCILATISWVTNDPGRIKQRGPIEPGGVMRFDQNGATPLYKGRTPEELAQPSGGGKQRKVS